MTPYRSVDHALRSAYLQDERPIIKTPSCFKIGGGGAVSEFWVGLGPWHRVAQSGMTHAVARDYLSGTLLAVMEMYYLSPSISAKDTWCGVVAEALWVEMAEYPDHDYLVDVCREWSGLRREKTERQWEADIGVSAKTLQRWRLGRDRYSSGASQILDGWLGRVRAELAPVFRDNGLIP